MLLSKAKDDVQAPDVPMSCHMSSEAGADFQPAGRHVARFCVLGAARFVSGCTVCFLLKELKE